MAPQAGFEPAILRLRDVCRRPQRVPEPSWESPWVTVANPLPHCCQWLASAPWLTRPLARCPRCWAARQPV